MEGETNLLSWADGLHIRQFETAYDVFHISCKAHLHRHVLDACSLIDLKVFINENGKRDLDYEAGGFTLKRLFCYDRLVLI